VLGSVLKRGLAIADVVPLLKPQHDRVWPIVSVRMMGFRPAALVVLLVPHSHISRYSIVIVNWSSFKPCQAPKKEDSGVYHTVVCALDLTCRYRSPALWSLLKAFAE
jgi:hypothetical protein